MKRILFSFCSIFSLVAFAEVITMDLTTATDMHANPISFGMEYGDGYYDISDVWDKTYNDSSIYQYIYTNEGRFMLSHLPSQNSYMGQSWEGFTVSCVSQDTANVFGCVANGGVMGEGTPYVVGYFSDWVTQTQGYSSNIILFDQEYYTDYVYLCQNSNTMQAIVYGNVFNARAFTEEDTLALIISGLDEELKETISITYYLAVDGWKNTEWVKIPLYELGRVAGLSFRMTTTDMGQFGMNTPMYFALDALTVNTEPITAVDNVCTKDMSSRKILHKGQLLLIKNKKVYTLVGQYVDKK